VLCSLHVHLIFALSRPTHLHLLPAGRHTALPSLSCMRKATPRFVECKFPRGQTHERINGMPAYVRLHCCTGLQTLPFKTLDTHPATFEGLASTRHVCPKQPNPALCCTLHLLSARPVCLGMQRLRPDHGDPAGPDPRRRSTLPAGVVHLLPTLTRLTAHNIQHGWTSKHLLTDAEGYVTCSTSPGPAEAQDQRRIFSHDTHSLCEYLLLPMCVCICACSGTGLRLLTVV